MRRFVKGDDTSAENYSHLAAAMSYTECRLWVHHQAVRDAFATYSQRDNLEREALQVRARHDNLLTDCYLLT